MWCFLLVLLLLLFDVNSTAITITTSITIIVIIIITTTTTTTTSITTSQGPDVRMWQDQPGLFITTGLNTGMTIKPHQTCLMQWLYAIDPEGPRQVHREFRDVVFEDVGFEHNSLQPLTHNWIPFGDRPLTLLRCRED